MKSPIDGPAFRPEGAATDLRTDCAIGVMAKSPRAGYSKTRLCPPLRPEQAARLSAAFLRDTTETLRAAAACVPIAGYAAYAPAGTKEALIPHLAPGTPLILADGSVPAPAGVEGFGRCLLHAVQALFDRGHAAACVLSADTPTLPTAILVTAATLLLTGSEPRGDRGLRRRRLLSPRHAVTPCGSVRRHRLEHRHCRGADAGSRGRAGSRPGSRSEAVDPNGRCGTTREGQSYSVLPR